MGTKDNEPKDETGAAEFVTVDVPIQPKGIYAKATDRHGHIHFLDPYSCSCFRMPQGGNPASYVAKGFTPLQVKTFDREVPLASGGVQLIKEPIIPDDAELLPVLKKRLPQLKEALDPQRVKVIEEQIAKREAAAAA